MNILWIEAPQRCNRYDDWLHTKFAERLGDYENLYMYGKGLVHPKAPIGYDKDITMDYLVGEYKLDVVLVDTINAAWDYYKPVTLSGDQYGDIMPKGFASSKVRKVCFEEDFHYETNTDWHEKMGFEFIIQRHYSQAQRKFPLEFKYLPWSVDTKVFKYNDQSRENKIGFAGTIDVKNDMSGQTSVYVYRETAIKQLEDMGLFASSKSYHHVFDAYIDYLRKYVGYVSCGSIFDLTSAKMWEIMASGGILLTNKMSGLETLFPEGSYLTYENDAKDVVSTARSLLESPSKQDEIRGKGIDTINKYHTHEIRCRELLEMLK